MDSGPDLEKALLNIDLAVKYDLAMSLVEETIPIWENYAKDPESLSYFDGVGNCFYIRYKDIAGDYQILEKEIVRKAIQTLKEEKIKSGSQTDNLEELGAKVKAHMDAIDIWDDWQPEEVEFTLYAINNFIHLYQGKCKGEEEPKLNHIIKLAGDALISSKVKTLDELLNKLFSTKINHQKQQDKPDQATGV